MSPARRRHHYLLTRRATVTLGAACLLLAGLIVPTAVTTAQAGPSVQPRTAPPTTTLAVIKVIGVGDTPLSIAVNSVDDTVYVGNQVSDTVSVINGRTATEDDTIPVGDAPSGVAIDQDDDTVYVTNQDDSTVSVINARTATEDDTISVGWQPRGIAVDHMDDTVYVTNRLSKDVSVISGRAATVAGPSISLGADLLSVAVNQADDTVYVTRLLSPGGSVSVIDGRSATTVGTPVAAGPLTPYGVAVDQVDDTVYVTDEDLNTVSIIDGHTSTVWTTLTVEGRPYGVAVDDTGANQGLVYVTTLDNNAVSVIGRVEPSLGTRSGTTGSPVTINVDVPQVDYDVDGATVESVSFGGATVLPTPLSGDSWQVTAPAGTPGSTVAVPVTVTFRGGLTASAGSFTLTTPPAALPPGAPAAVSATAGNASATVTWAAPADTGSFPISTYEVRTTPAGTSCLVTTLTCTITGLANGTAYSFETRALNGAGWGPWSTPSNTVTPIAPLPPSITITGSRGTGADRFTITVTGTSTGLTGTQVRAHVKLRGQADYQPGRLVDLASDGSFTWQRSTRRKAYVYFTGDAIRSNRVIIPAAPR